MITNIDLERRFKYYPPKDESVRVRHEAVRDICRDAAEGLMEETGPPSREQSTAITKLEEAMFWANAAIARGEAPEE